MFLSVLKESEKEDFLNLVINIANIDGEFTDREKSQITAYVLEMGLSVTEFDNYNTSSEVLIERLSKSSLNSKKAIFMEIIALMLVDGMKKEEKDLLAILEEKFEFNSSFTEKVASWYQQILPLYRKGFELFEKGE